ncbi:MAG: lysylphosphatidylglycerol synthase domain-containing protein [Candidatus Saccharimonadales bacterium]
MSRTLLKQIAAVTVLIVTGAAFAYYFKTHPEVGKLLRDVPLTTLGILLLLYIATVGALVLIFTATLRLCKLKIEAGEVSLLTAYSSVINFFGPLQSGPAFRAVWLYQKYKLNLKAYAMATFVYYLFFGFFSGLFLISGLFGWWTLLLSIIGASCIYFAVGTRWIAPRLKNLDMRGWYYLAIATLIQVSLMAVIYTIELKAVDPNINVGQAIIYTGAANLALFVSLTPGAIGFREAFLLFSQQLHHISPSVIVATNILDRTLYITLMLLLGIFIFGSQANKRFKSATDKKAVS